MSPDEYWFGDPHLIYAYEACFENLRRLKQQDMWLMGTYIQRALSSVPLNVNGFIEKQSQVENYPECPYQDLFNEPEPPNAEQKALYEKAKSMLMARGLLRDD